MMPPQKQHWYCLKAKTKREHIAASILRSRENLEVFCPRITLTKKTVRGPKAFTEALFPGYLFCKFDYEESSRLVSFSRHIIGIVKFGTSTPTLPESTISELRRALPQEVAEVVAAPIKPGDLAEIVDGCFAGEQGRVIKVESTTQRINLLIEFLGNQVNIEVSGDKVINPNAGNPAAMLGLTPTK